MNILINGTWQEELPKLKSDSIDLIIIDPPYMVTKEKWDKENQVTEELSRQLFRILKPTGNFYCWGGIGEKSQTIIDWFLIFKNSGWYFKDWITWGKQRGMGMRKGWLYTREELLWFCKDNKQFYWNIENQYSDIKRVVTMSFKDKEREKKYLSSLKSGNKRIRNVWDDIRETNIAWNNKEKQTTHFTPKPIKAIERIILAHTKEGDTVLDCFLGSGTTMQACNNLNRNCIGIEKELEYYEYCKQFETTP